MSVTNRVKIHSIFLERSNPKKYLGFSSEDEFIESNEQLTYHLDEDEVTCMYTL